MPDFNLENLPEFRVSPPIISDFTDLLEQADIRQIISSPGSQGFRAAGLHNPIGSVGPPIFPSNPAGACGPTRISIGATGHEDNELDMTDSKSEMPVGCTRGSQPSNKGIHRSAPCVCCPSAAWLAVSVESQTQPARGDQQLLYNHLTRNKFGIASAFRISI
ncbi:hypothetical protein PCANC_09482 [Puccinia coronata f. sp. avenae]|uniref:Uncharacterized protein n=1 Tax=Puccinia coronata f. sp. avenae TaxID=200324 RepID=A0A2N5VVJ1_9BASI|nr:hypothetical protein PCANC_09482 [Puccinia coronata f. sp. avenae]